jgi:ubiquinone/menaquinone biosynthesis C-methylase UbiE
MSDPIDGSMRLGRFEFKAMNNPFRRFFQKHVEFKIFIEHLKKHNIDLSGTVIMDAGCGSGYSTELIVQEFAPKRVYAFDYMPEQIELARKRIPDVDFFIGDMQNLTLQDNCCDACFIFGVIHHIPRWKEALKEVYRVLKSKAVMLLEEPMVGFTWPELEKGITGEGFKILSAKSFCFGYFHSYLCGK